jgi:class 3 adenylate cyclase
MAGPAIEAALEIRESTAGVGLPMRAVLQTGEIELAPSDVAGIAVHVAARVAPQARADEVLMSRVVKRRDRDRFRRFQSCTPQ